MHKSANKDLEPLKPETRVYSEGFCLLEKIICENEVPPLPNHFLKYSGKSIFNFFKYKPKRSKKNLEE